MCASFWGDRMSNGHVTPPQATALTSWKEIASYLGKGVRTVQRWECQFGLPVRRPNEKSKGVVYASRSELDQWLARHWSRRPGKFPTAEPANGNGKTLVATEIAVSQELHGVQQKLLGELRRSLQLLAERCQILVSNVSRAKGLNCARPASLLLRDRCPPAVASRPRSIAD
jgi:hypothetical protein